MNRRDRFKPFERPIDPSETTDRIGDLLEESLQAASHMHDILGEAGEEKIEKDPNSIGSRLAEGTELELLALRADWECEEAVLETLQRNGLPIRVVSEEHGVIDLADSPRYLGVLDGLDGTGVYKEKRGTGRYGTMFAIFESIDPTYADYIASGIMEHSTGRMFVATKGGGAFVIENGERTPIHTSGQTELDPQRPIYIDTAYTITNKTFTKKVRPFKPFWEGPLSSGSMAVHHADVASGKADLAFECSRKGVLEEAASFGLITEAGGAVVDVNGQSLGDKKYFEFGQFEQIPLIVAATAELAQAVVEHLQSGFERNRAGYFADFIRGHIHDYKFLTSPIFGLGPKPRVKGPETGIYVTNRSREDEDMRNVVKHCVIESDALEDLSAALGLPAQEIEDLGSAAFVHDFYKVTERNKDKGKAVEGQTNEAIVEAEHESADVLRKHGYSEDVIRIVSAVGHNSVDRIMDPDCTLPEKLMFLIDAATNDEVIIGARKKTGIMRGRNKEIEKAGDYDRLDAATDHVEQEIIQRLDDPAVQTAEQLYDWINSRMIARIMAWGAHNLAGNSNQQQ